MIRQVIGFIAGLLAVIAALLWWLASIAEVKADDELSARHRPEGLQTVTYYDGLTVEIKKNGIVIDKAATEWRKAYIAKIAAILGFFAAACAFLYTYLPAE